MHGKPKWQCAQRAHNNAKHRPRAKICPDFGKQKRIPSPGTISREYLEPSVDECPRRTSTSPMRKVGYRFGDHDIGTGSHDQASSVSIRDSEPNLNAVGWLKHQRETHTVGLGRGTDWPACDHKPRKQETLLTRNTTME